MSNPFSNELPKDLAIGFYTRFTAPAMVKSAQANDLIKLAYKNGVLSVEEAAYFLAADEFEKNAFLDKIRGAIGKIPAKMGLTSPTKGVLPTNLNPVAGLNQGQIAQIQRSTPKVRPSRASQGRPEPTFEPGPKSAPKWSIEKGGRVDTIKPAPKAQTATRQPQAAAPVTTGPTAPKPTPAPVSPTAPATPAPAAPQASPTAAPAGSRAAHRAKYQEEYNRMQGQVASQKAAPAATPQTAPSAAQPVAPTQPAAPSTQPAAPSTQPAAPTAQPRRIGRALMAVGGLGVGILGSNIGNSQKTASLNKLSMNATWVIPAALGLGTGALGTVEGARQGSAASAQIAREKVKDREEGRVIEDSVRRWGLAAGGVAGGAATLAGIKMKKPIQGTLKFLGATPDQADGIHKVVSVLGGAGAGVAAGNKAGEVYMNQREKDLMHMKTAGLYMKPSDLSEDPRQLSRSLERALGDTPQSKEFKAASLMDIGKWVVDHPKFAPTLAGATIGGSYELLRQQFSDPTPVPGPVDPNVSFVGQTTQAVKRFNSDLDKVFRDNPKSAIALNALAGGAVGFVSQDAVAALSGLLNTVEGKPQ